MLEKFTSEKINLGVYVRDKVTGKNAYVSGIHEDDEDGMFIYIKFDPREPDHERRPDDLEIHVWSEEEVEEVNKKAKKLRDFFKDEEYKELSNIME